MLALILVGAALRVRLYACDQSLWWDEASIADNLASRSFAGLLQPLDYDQSAPIAWLMLVKAAAVLLGQGELSLRLVPLLSALAALPVFWLLARRLLPVPAAFLAMGLFAICPSAIGFAAEAKQYSSDALAALLALWATVAALQSGLARRKLAVLAVTGAALIWFSHSVAFVLAGGALVLAIHGFRYRSRRSLGCLAAVAIAWAGSFVADWVWFLHRSAHNAFMLRYWTFAFAPEPFDAGAWGWYGKAVAGMFRNPGGFGIPILPIGLALLGLVAIGRRSGPAVVMMIAPAVLSFVASMLGKYPFHERMLMFLVPSIVLTVAAGAWLLGRVNPRPLGGMLAGLALVLVAGGPLQQAGQTAVRPDSKGSADIAPILRDISANWREGDVIYAHWGLAFAFKYYAHRTSRLPYALVIESPRAEEDPGRYRRDLTRYREHRRVWVAFGKLADQEAWEHLLAPVRLAEYRAAGGAEVWLCDLSRLPEGS